METIYAYTDHRVFVQDFLSDKRKKNPKYSLRCAAEKCGVPSGTFARILNGTRGIGPSLLPKFSNWLGLKHREADYFGLLVKFQQCTSVNDRDKYYEELLSCRVRMKHLIPEDKFHFFEQWYHVALHELLKIVPDTNNPEQLGALLEPAVNESKTRNALEIMEKAGIIKRTPEGLKPAASFLSTGDTWESAAIHAFQRIMCSLGTEALDRFAKSERDMSTLSMSLSEKGFREVIEVIRGAREKIREVEQSDNAPERVYQINFQIFPLSRRNDRSKL